MNNVAQTSRKREEFSFRYSPYTDTPEGKLTAFLKQGDGVRPGKELILEAARAFWMVTACQTAEEISPQALRQLGLNCCRALERQADYIRACLQLPPTTSEPLPPNPKGDRQPRDLQERVTQTMWQ